MKDKIDFKVSRGGTGTAGGQNTPVVTPQKKKVKNKNKNLRPKKRTMISRGSGLFQNLPHLWQVDLIFILLTVAGCAAVFINLEKVETVILYVVYNLLNLFGVIALIGGLVLLVYLFFFRRRRRW